MTKCLFKTSKRGGGGGGKGACPLAARRLRHPRQTYRLESYHIIILLNYVHKTVFRHFLSQAHKENRNNPHPQKQRYLDTYQQLAIRTKIKQNKRLTMKIIIQHRQTWGNPK